uniref:Uncharacterized protein n=1 Tax=Candidatus Kentrum sp. MB TaxID=2138164 RepID=A0A451BGH8_9GAMM|nr:MAG: hypothetical protein BECKMB1821G_GA0114241_11237 [Candidatus Kentron sp. MB]VFK35778.1 MAG: hypothetical protein BECKMB1821I_GA0114274_11452 [Candidatus Kentron sp. MB]VFK77381.1 MAG: hypothetical protein BECKMB1821H_GA0114242_11306 [Candidatus Kentron sp. MB]
MFHMGNHKKPHAKTNKDKLWLVPRTIYPYSLDEPGERRVMCIGNIFFGASQVRDPLYIL